MLLLSKEWRRWRRSLQRSLTFSSSTTTVPWLILLLATVIQAQGYPPYPHSHPPHPHNHNHNHNYHPPPPGPPGPPPQQGPLPAQPYLTGPSQQPPQNFPNPPNHYYQIDSNSPNRLVQRQLPQGASGITAAATNYLLQQLQMERQQQQLQHRSMQGGPQGPVGPQGQMSPQQQTLQLLANLTPDQISALQQVIPTLPRSVQDDPNNNGGPSSSPRVPMNGFSSRIGPFDKLFNRAKSWLPDMMSSGSTHSRQGGNNGNGGSSGDGNGVGEPKMRDLHRLPKPPQYPLYDLPSQATPPPAPIMHPMASLPNSAFDLDQPSMQSSSPRSANGPMASGSNFNQQNWISPGPTMATSRRSRPSMPQRPPKPSKPSFSLRNPLGRSKKPRPSPEPPIRRNHGGPPGGPRRREPPPTPRSRGRTPPITTRPKKVGPPRGRLPSGGRRPPPPPPSGPTSDPYGSSGPSGSGGSQGFDHPMASNLSPAQSPALGRPLSYEEYMARPSHSYTNDPWNFDPFASQMNQGLHTHALRYNYDPLGMNALDTEANSHLDPNKLSYPGDSFNQDMVKDSPGIGQTGQIGGWDKPYKKRPYDSDPETELTPPLGGGNPFGQSSSSNFPSSPNDPFSGGVPSSLGSSSNRYRNNNNNNGGGSSSGAGTGFLGDALSGGRLGEMPMSNGPMDQFEGGSNMPNYNNDGAPTIDLESLSGPSQDDDGMSGLEFTIETSMDKGSEAMGSVLMDQDQGQGHQGHPDHHPLGPMQPAPNPYLSDQYNPYGDHSAPSTSQIPGSPYGPNGYRERERYGRRRTRNNHGRPPPRLSRRRGGRGTLRPRPSPGPRKLINFSSSPPPPPPQSTMGPMPSPHSMLMPSPASMVPEGVQIFNEIMMRQSTNQNQGPPQQHRQRHLPNPQRVALRRSLYNAIRH